MNMLPEFKSHMAQSTNTCICYTKICIYNTNALTFVCQYMGFNDNGGDRFHVNITWAFLLRFQAFVTQQIPADIHEITIYRHDD